MSKQLELYDIVCYNNQNYEILSDRGIGFRKRVYLAQNLNTKEFNMIFYPCTTFNHNNINININKFKNDIDLIENIYKTYGNKCKIIPYFTSKESLVIITNFIDKNRYLYQFLCDE